MLAWSEGTDNGRQKTRNHGYDVIVGGEFIYWLLRSPRKLVTLKPKTQINRRRTPPASFPLVGCSPQAAWPERLLSESQDAVALQQIGDVALYLWLIVVISVRQSTVAAISGLACRALVMVSSSTRLTAWLQNSKKWAERSERLMYEQSHRDYLRSGYLHHRLPVSGLLIITVMKRHYLQSPARQKCQRTGSWRTRQLPMWRVSVMLLRSIKYTKELADAKAEKWCSAWWCCRWSSSAVHQSARQSVKPNTTASGVDNAASPDWQTPLNGIISPSERGWSLCKNNWKEPRSILMSSEIELPISMGNSCNYCEHIHALPAEYKCFSYKTCLQSIYECLLLCFNNIFCAATNFGCIDSFLLPNSETKKWWALVLLLSVCFVINVCWACNPQQVSYSE